jgi:hypothetical protein
VSTEIQRQKDLARYYDRLTKAKEHLGGRCVVCGTTENLEFDHINPAVKLFTLTKRRLSKEKFEAELIKCQLLCHEHHLKKTAEERRSKEHGTWGMYKRCHCLICKAFVSGKMKEYKGRKPTLYGGRGRYGTITEHGGGRSGIKGCKCTSCLAIRAKTARERRAAIVSVDST